ncbi:hypothetical protein HID58_033960 [Brassica napus]|uniref:RING-type domain-containing protein n=1 Tax=Brassica napus TaxID=3708 RepID=A0ABQ7XA85_BRANA|nr:hypothetical protein HID58_090958 [Brassica napus]KAH0910639.1 hypothetical protein HID58_033960 [Brassica napus]
MSSSMNVPQVELSIDRRRLPPSVGYTSNNVRIMINTCFHEVLENLTTRQRTLTGRFVLLSPPVLIDFNLSSLSNSYIQELLRDNLAPGHHWLCQDLAADISSEAEELGKIDIEEHESLTTPCSICLDNLYGSSSIHGSATLMNCSHVFHERCLSDWLQRHAPCVGLCCTIAEFGNTWGSKLGFSCTDLATWDTCESNC